MDLTDRSQRTVKAWMERVVVDCLAKGRHDVIAALESGGYRTVEESPLIHSMWVRLEDGEECVSRIRVNPGGDTPELLN